MGTPFTSDQFFEVMENYNETVFPAQILFYLLGIYAVYLAINKKSPRIVALILSFFWLWMGTVYHLLFFTTINNAAYLFGVLFMVQGILFLSNGVFKNELSFEFRLDKYGISGIILISYALVIYPVLGYFFGHIYPTAPTFGLPYPTTIFTFGLLLFCSKRCPVYILIIPVIWSIIGFTAVFKFGVIEDAGLIITAFYTLAMLFVRNRTASSNTRSKQSLDQDVLTGPTRMVDGH